MLASFNVSQVKKMGKENLANSLSAGHDSEPIPITNIGLIFLFCNTKFTIAQLHMEKV